MTTIWVRRDEGWKRLGSESFPDEAALHTLVEEAPHTLPLSGSPSLVVLGREVRLGSGRVDLLAVEPDGRPVVIEIKLAKSSEARRAVVAQVLSYAAALYELDVAALQEVLASHLSGRRIADVVAEGAALPEFDRAGFDEALAENLSTGSMRLVIVLDAAPPELVQIAGFLESVTTERILIDLVVVSSYTVGGTLVMVPQRVDPARAEATGPMVPSVARARADKTRLVEGHEAFIEEARKLRPDDEPVIAAIEAWCAGVQDHSDMRLQSYFGVQWTVLLPRLRSQDASLVSFYLNEKGITGQAFRSVFERVAPDALGEFEGLLGKEIGQGTGTGAVTRELIRLVAVSYQAALSS